MSKNHFVAMAEKLDLANKLPEGYTIQGEIFGEGIQKNPHKVKGHDFRAFNVYNHKEGKYLDFEEAKKFTEGLGLKWVDSEQIGTLKDETMQTLLDKADKTGLEGLVFRPTKEVRDPKFGRVSFKAISNKYLLKNE